MLKSKFQASLFILLISSFSGRAAEPEAFCVPNGSPSNPAIEELKGNLQFDGSVISHRAEGKASTAFANQDSHLMSWRELRISLSVLEPFEGVSSLPELLKRLREVYGQELRIIRLGDPNEKLSEDFNQLGEFENIPEDAELIAYYSSEEGQHQTTVQLDFNESAGQFIPAFYYPQGDLSIKRKGMEKDLIIIGPTFVRDPSDPMAFSMGNQSGKDILTHEMVHKWISDQTPEKTITMNGKKVSFENRILADRANAVAELEKANIQTTADIKRDPKALFHFLNTDLEEVILWIGEEIDVTRFLTTHREALGMDAISTLNAFDFHAGHLVDMERNITQIGDILKEFRPADVRAFDQSTRQEFHKLSNAYNKAYRNLLKEWDWRREIAPNLPKDDFALPVLATE